MIRIRKGIVTSVDRKDENFCVLNVEMSSLRCSDDPAQLAEPQHGMQESAIAFPQLTGEIVPGDMVVINTTASFLDLGTGSYNIVMSKCDPKDSQLTGKGHIIKLRYTPFQHKCLALEEPDSPYRKAIENFVSMDGVPVVTAPLHSLIMPVIMGFKYFMPEKVVTYVMTDSAALPIQISDNVRELKRRSLLSRTITAGQAFGGDLESVNLYTALIAAKEALGSDLIVVAPGPGKVGTGTRYGFSEIEQGEMINAVNVLGGTAIACLRINLSDSSYRHYGISDHSLTILREICLSDVKVPLPSSDAINLQFHNPNLKELQKLSNVTIEEIDVSDAADIFDHFDLKPTTMNKSYDEESIFFSAGIACAKLAISLIDKDRQKQGFHG